MKNHFLYIQILLQLLFMVFITSCHGQTKPDSSDKSINEFISTQNEYPKIKRPAGAEGCIFRCSYQDVDGNLWFGTSGGAGVYRYDGKTFTNFKTQNGLNSNSINAIIGDTAGNVLFATNTGIIKYDGKTFSELTKEDDLSKKNIAALIEDKKGNLWLSTMQTGVYCYNGKTFTNYLSGNEAIMDIMEDKAGNLWFSSWHHGGVWKYDGNTFINYKPSADYYLGSEISNNSKDDNSYKNLPSITSLPQANITEDMIFSISDDKAGNIWFSTRRHGACKYDGKSFLNFTANNGFADVGMYDILQDKNGNYWFATEKNGVWRYDGKSFKNFNTGDGLINNSVFDIFEDSSGYMWFGTRDFGLYRYDGRKFYNMTEL